MTKAQTEKLKAKAPKRLEHAIKLRNEWREHYVNDMRDQNPMLDLQVSYYKYEGKSLRQVKLEYDIQEIRDLNEAVAYWERIVK